MTNSPIHTSLSGTTKKGLIIAFLTSVSMSPLTSYGNPLEHSAPLKAAPAETKGSTVSTVVKNVGSGAKTNSPMALYAEQAVMHYNKAVNFHRQGLLDQAIAEYEAAIQSDDRMSEAYTNLGTIYVAREDYKGAIKVLSRSYSVSPNSVVTLNAFAGALFNDGKKEQAVDLWKRAIKLDPKFSSAYPNLADALDDLGRANEAKEIRNLAPGAKPSKKPVPVKIDTVGDFDNGGEIPLHYQPKNR